MGGTEVMMMSPAESFDVVPTVEEEGVVRALGAGVPGLRAGLAMLNKFATVPRLGWCSKCYAEAQRGSVVKVVVGSQSYSF